MGVSPGHWQDANVCMSVAAEGKEGSANHSTQNLVDPISITDVVVTADLCACDNNVWGSHRVSIASQREHG